MEYIPIIIVWGLLLVIVLGTLRGLYNWITGKKSAGGFICPTCGTCGNPKQITRGNILIELILWLCFLIPGLIYSIWRLSTRYSACPACGTTGMIPVNSPNGKRLSEQNNQP